MAGQAEPERQAERPGDHPHAQGDGGRSSSGGSGFNRERFLLRLVAVILIAEVLLFTLASTACIALAQRRPLPEKSLCHRADSSLEAAFAVALNTLLALLGGKAIGDSAR
ncbi:hypothetical protein KQ306_08810 [Synechococcus sp. CS-1324]|uniref:hypothetical protein n=1 Tax=Synechococcus sp. CS-1324 TaxID=2847980 RepID=UPI000DB21550|nr:hypothetical protein [Synechococcus sp. CS-1324]MCT0230948.1 hypothetical protein [Synechococcus sp. CS-1324]PZV04198.1 MAG: hypothetical protein DCF23_07175 [Cyanobium sp.]